MRIRYAVSIEVCHLLSQEEADAVAEKIRGAFDDDDLQEDVYLCVSAYEQVSKRADQVRGDEMERMLPRIARHAKPRLWGIG